MSLSRRHFLALSSAALALPATGQTVPVIAAAASLRFVMDPLLAGFAETGGAPIRVAFGSSGTLAQQILHGAPFEMFLSADEAYVQLLAEDGPLPDAGRIYARGRLALIAPNPGNLPIDPALDGLAAELDAGTLRRFAIASPEHAPYGVAAREALRHRRLWDRVQPFLLFGENVSQAAQFAVSGNADGGLVAASLASAGPVAAKARSTLIAEDWHAPLNQRMALTATAGETTRAFHDFLLSAPAQEIFAANGFAPPDPT